MTHDQLPYCGADKYGAARLLLAASRTDPTERLRQVERVLRESSSVSLLSGLVHFGLTFAGQIYGPSRETFLNNLVTSYAIEDANPETHR